MAVVKILLSPKSLKTIMSELNPILKAVIAATASFNPITNAIFTGVTTYRGEIEMRFVKEVIMGVNERINKLEQRIDKEYIKSDDYMNFLYKTLGKAAGDVRKEKLKMFANIIVNSALIGRPSIKDGNKYLYDETIDKIDDSLFEFLLRLCSRGMVYDENRNAGWRGDDEDLKQLCVDERTFFFYVDYLLSVGVLVRLPNFEIDDNGVMSYYAEYFVTQYGYDFVEYVRDQI